MCIPPVDEDPGIYFKEMKNLSNELNLQELSMGMSEDYMIAAKNFFNISENWYKNIWKKKLNNIYFCIFINKF